MSADLRKFYRQHARIALSGGAALLLWMATPLQADALDNCLASALQTADDTTTVGSLRAGCLLQLQQQASDSLQESLAAAASPVDKRMVRESITSDNPWLIVPHHPNYILPLTYNDRVNSAPFEGLDFPISHAEAKFQISFKFPLVRDFLNKRTQVYAAYTNQSWWQLYAQDASSPFRETNHEPEIFLVTQTNWNLLGWRNSLATFGINHQSNGRQVPLSRSWNRIYASVGFERNNWLITLKPWYRIPEDKKDDPLQSLGDDNPDLLDYMGDGQIRVMHERGGKVYSLMLRNLFADNSDGAVELTYSFPIIHNIKGYVQYFNGYGESLIDYNARTHRIGFGIAISDWL